MDTGIGYYQGRTGLGYAPKDNYTLRAGGEYTDYDVRLERFVQKDANGNMVKKNVPRATVSGNMFSIDALDERVLGYFEAVATDTYRVILSRIDFPLTKVSDPYGADFFVENLESCRNCLTIPNSTLKNPSYWPN